MKLMKKVLPVILAGTMVFGTVATGYAAEDAWSIADVTAKELTYTIDGEDVAVKLYTDYYLKEGGIGDATGSIQATQFTADNPQDQYENARVNIYVPETATEDSPIIYAVNNSGWLNNIFVEETDGSALLGGTAAASTSSLEAAALKNGWVVVNAGLRTRGMYDLASETYNHAPVTVADAKAVIRYLKHNDAAVLGDADKIFVTGTSGGGALTAALASNGNSDDFTAELEKIGAYMDATDDIMGAIAYCPITDLGHADGSYEYTYAGTRQLLKENGFVAKMVVLGPGGGVVDDATLSDTSLEISPELAFDYAKYVNSLGIAGSDNAFNTSGLKASGTLYDTMVELLKDCLQGALDSYGEEEFFETIAKRGVADEAEPPMKTSFYAVNADAYEDALATAGITVDDGKITDLDVDKYLYYVAAGEVIKPAPAFTNQDLYNGARNENNLFGDEDDAHGYTSKLVFDLIPDTSVVKAKYKTWEAYKAAIDVEEQSAMTDSIAYLTSSDGESAPYWWVRHGSVDRDTSFANQTLLYLALEADDSIEKVDFEFAFNKPHIGGYDVADVVAFVKASLEDAAANDTTDDGTTDDGTTDDSNTNGGATSDGDDDDDKKSPTTEDSFGFLAVAVVAAAGLAFAARRRVVR